MTKKRSSVLSLPLFAAVCIDESNEEEEELVELVFFSSWYSSNAHLLRICRKENRTREQIQR